MGRRFRPNYNPVQFPLSSSCLAVVLAMAIPADGHERPENLADEREKNHGFVEIVELNDRAYFKAQLLDINPDIRQYYVRYV